MKLKLFIAEAEPLNSQIGEYGVEAAVVAAKTSAEARKIFEPKVRLKQITIKPIRGATLERKQAGIIYLVSHVE